MIFLLFDIEIAFLYPWALALRDLGWFGFFQILTFFGILAVGYVFIWRKGVLDWGPAVRQPRRIAQDAMSRRVA
jgi:NADH-quinone oxidoreductase subunit A